MKLSTKISVDLEFDDIEVLQFYLKLAEVRGERLGKTMALSLQGGMAPVYDDAQGPPMTSFGTWAIELFKGKKDLLLCPLV